MTHVRTTKIRKHCKMVCKYVVHRQSNGCYALTALTPTETKTIWNLGHDDAVERGEQFIRERQ